MKIRMIFCVLALAAANALATPVQFISAVSTNTDVTTLGASADTQSNQSPTSAVLLITESTQFNDTGDSATASSTNGLGLLNTYAEVFTATGSALGDATAEFTGTFDWSKRFLVLDFLFAGVPDAAESDLFVTVRNGGGSAVFSDAFSTPGNITLNIDLPLSGRYTLDLLLASTAFVSAGGSQFSGADVQFSATVAEPSTWALMGLALLIVLCVTRRQSTSNRHLFA